MPRQFFSPSGIGELDRHEGAGVQLMSGRVFLRACECGLKKSFEPKAGAKRSQRLRAGHRRSKSEGQKENLNRFCQARPQAVPIGTEPKATQVRGSSRAA